MICVVINYSFDCETPVYLFDTETEAMDFIKNDFENELKLQEEENNATMLHGENNGEYARIEFFDGERIEWTLTFASDKREKSERTRMRDAYLAITDLLENDPRECMTDEDAVGEMYAEAANFANAVENLGYAF